MPLTTNDALLEAWAEQIETMEQNLEALYGPPGITPTLPPITTEEAMLEAIAEEAEKSAWEFAKIYNETTEVSTDAYSVTVPSTALYCAELNSVGGKTIAWNQQVDAETTSVVLKSGRKYFTLISGTASIVTGDGSAIDVTGGTDMVCDLTLMFFSGNEPATVEDFYAIFPEPDTAYNVGELLSAGVTEIVSKDSSGKVLGTYTIPDEVQALTGYGWSANTIQNYIDFDRKVFVQNVGQMVMDGTTTYHKVTGNFTSKPNVCYASNLAFKKAGNHSKVISDRFVPVTFGSANMPEYTFVGGGGADTTVSFAMPSPIATVAEANAWFEDNNTEIYYPLTTPVETDISAYLDGDTIKIVPGGTLEFHNQSGYNIAVPVTAEYIGV